MEYFYVFQCWLYESSMYQHILREMPAPLNNIYFDSFLVIGLVIYLVYRLVETVRISRYRRRIRRMREADRKLQNQKEEEMAFRERKVQEKEERIGRFLDYMEFLFSGRVRQQEQYGNVRPEKGNRRLGSRRFLLERKQAVGEVLEDTVRVSSDYDVVMDAFACKREQEQEVTERQQREREQMDVFLNNLEASFRVEEREADVEEVDGFSGSAEFEKRKVRARREEEKERKRTEKLLRKQERGGARHGRLGK